MLFNYLKYITFANVIIIRIINDDKCDVALLTILKFNIMIRSAFLSIAMFFSIPISAFNPESEKLIKEAMIKGKVSDISSILSDNVNMIILGKNSKEVKKKAIDCISPFFAENPKNEFNVLHKGVKGDTSFLIASFSFEGKKYRIHFLSKQQNNKDIINQIRIENNNE